MKAQIDETPRNGSEPQSEGEELEAQLQTLRDRLTAGNQQLEAQRRAACMEEVTAVLVKHGFEFAIDIHPTTRSPR